MVDHTGSPAERNSRDPLKIAVLVKSFISTGGSERHTVEVAQRLLQKGHRIDLYARLADPELSRGMDVYQVPNRYKFSSVLNFCTYFLSGTFILLRNIYFDMFLRFPPNRFAMSFSTESARNILPSPYKFNHSF